MTDENRKTGEGALRRDASAYGENPADHSADASEASRNYWQAQDAALGRVRANNRAWSEKRRAGQKASGGVWKRESYALPREQAQAKAREFLKKYPKAAYWSEVETWRELPGDVIEFTMRRLPTAD